ncbi:hypothetical protein [Alteromonas sp. A079]|uniref:hypothetical protein n=1 Tax=Alteromonas sp. A079 TaxID=3410268 RepID=UPI003BA306EC
MKNIKKLITLSSLSIFLFSGVANAALITPGIIWGNGNTNQGFTIATSGNLELGLRAKQRYASPNDQLGVGIVQDSDGNYLFDSTGVTVPSNRSIWSFDWSINSDTLDGDSPLSTYTYLIGVDYNPSSAMNIQSYNPVSGTSTGYYLGNNSSWINADGNKSSAANVASFVPADGTSNLSSMLDDFNIAQNSVNMGFLPGAPVGAGQYTVSLSAFSGNDLVTSTSINVFVDTVPVSAPATSMLFIASVAAVALRRKSKPNTHK